MSEFEFGHATDVGRVRSLNQDRCLGDGSIFAVADGMGGHSGGEVAAQLAVDALVHRSHQARLADLLDLVHEANDDIIAAAREDPGLRGMGTTLCVLAALDPFDGESRLGVVNVGDSRVYRLDGDSLDQITEDHSLVEALVRDGRLSREEAGRHPQRNILTRALGIDDKVLVDGWELRAATGDRYLVCSDGLFNELESSAISRIVSMTDDPRAAARQLVSDAGDAGGHDNITAVVVHVVSADTMEPGDERIVTVRRAVPDAPIHTPVDEADARPDDSSAELDETSDDDTPEAVASPRRLLTWRLGLLVAVVVIVLVILVTAVAAYARSAYFVGVDGGDVVIFQGRPGGVLWFDPTFEEPVNIGLAELDGADLDDVTGGVEFGELDDAREFGRELALRTRA